jgi:hypothetical protein
MFVLLTRTLWREAGAMRCVRIRLGAGCARCPRLHRAEDGSIPIEHPHADTSPTTVASSRADSLLGTKGGPESTAWRYLGRERHDTTMPHAPMSATTRLASSAIAADDGAATATIVTHTTTRSAVHPRAVGAIPRRTLDCPNTTSTELEDVMASVSSANARPGVIDDRD